MTFNPETTMRVLKTHVDSLSQFQERVYIGDPPDRVMPEGLSAIITLAGGGPTGTSTLEAPFELYRFRILIYRAKAAGAREEDALLRYRTPQEIEALLRADFTLGGNVINVSFGEFGAQPTWEFDEEEIADTPYWVTRMEVPVIVYGNSVTFVA